MSFGSLGGSGGFGPFQTNDPGFKKRRAQQAQGAFDGTAAYEQALREDRQFYNDNFVTPTMDLRSIALGMGSGNEYQAAREAMARSTRVSNAVGGAFARDVQRAGGADPAKVDSQRRRLGLSRIIAQVDSANVASRGARARQEAAAAAGTQLYGDLTSDANRSLSSIALAELDRDQQYRDAQAQGKRNVTQVSGMVASMFI